MRIWESGIVLAKYFTLVAPAALTTGKVVVELGSGTGITGLAVMKYTEAAKVVFTDHE